MGGSQPTAGEGRFWLPWSEGLFQRAADLGRPLLVYFAIPGWNEVLLHQRPSLQSIVQQKYVATRVNPFYRPDVAARFSTDGWPAFVLILPDGRPFAAAVDIPHDNLELYLLRQAKNFAQKRSVIESKLRPPAAREPKPPLTANEVFLDTAERFDLAHGGFGDTGPKYLNAPVLRFLTSYGSQEAVEMVQRTLDATLGSAMHSRDGGFFSFSYSPDWRTPGPEQDLADQAVLLSTLLDQSQPTSNLPVQLFEEMAAAFFDSKRGVFHGRRMRDEDGGWSVDPAIYTGRNVAAIRACLAVFGRLADERAWEMARRAMRYLLENNMTDGGWFYHHSGIPEGAQLVLADDQALAALAMLDLALLDPDAPWMDRAWRIAEGLKRQDATLVTDGAVTPATVELLWRLGERQAARTLMRQQDRWYHSLDATADFGRALLTIQLR
jgi:uncharacterized protein YyaL (SSP411 family)